MNAVDAFCEREARRAASRPTLAEALLAGRGLAYAAHRTRFLAARVPVRVVLHLVEVMLLGSLFPVEDLGPIFGVRAALSIASALGWGALEPLRVTVREHARTRSWTRATDTIRDAVIRSVDLGLVQLAVAVLWIRFGPSEFDSFSIFDAYALAAGLRACVETVARTYAAGIGALRRVPRPFWAGLPGDVVDLCGAILIWPVAGAWGFAGSLLVGGLLRATLTVVYARRAYQTSPLRRLRLFPVRRRPRSVTSEERRHVVESAFANATAQLDGWILIVLSVTASSEQDGFIVAAIHVLRPLLSASIGWTRLFYLDLKQLEVRGVLLQRRFDRLLRRFAVGLALVTSALLLLAWPLVFEERPSVTVAWLAPFLVVRALFALHQTRAFSFGRMRYLLRTAGVVGAGLAAIATVPLLREHSLPALTALLAAVLVRGRGGLEQPRGGTSNVLGLYCWLSELAAATGPVHVSAAVVPRQLTVPTRRIAAELSRALGVQVTTWGSRHVLWFERGDCEAVAERQRVVAASAGCLSAVSTGPTAAAGRAALSAAIEARVLEPGLAARLRAATTDDAATLATVFRQRFPRGAILDAAEGRATVVAPEGASVQPAFAVPMRQALGEVLRQTEGPGGRPARALPGHVTVFCPRGEPEVVFFLPPGADTDLRVAWRRHVEDATLAASLR